MITYYACSICHAEKHYTRDIIKHFNQKHGKRIKTLECTSLARFQPVHYLENIMKCPVCNDGLLWKQIFVEHLRDKHNLLDLANYIETNYGDSCPCMLSVPGHLVKSCTKFGSDVVAEVTESSESLTISRFHCEDCEFSTNDSDAYWQHQTSHSQTRTESDSFQKDDDAVSVNSTPSDHTLYHRAAKVKALRSITPKSPKRQNQSPKRNVELHQKSPVLRQKRKVKFRRKSPMLKRTASKSQEYHEPSRMANAMGAAVASKNATAQPQSTDSAGFLTKFIEKLPSSFVFTEELKCPACDFASRVRINLQRHVLQHIKSDATVSNNSVLSESNAMGAPVTSKNATAQPQSTHCASFLAEFIEKLPSFYVFTEEIKCPACDFASRVRMNLERHVLQHSRSGAAVSNSCLLSKSKTGESSLSYDLWKPYSSISSAASTEDEPLGSGILESRNDVVSRASLNSADNDSQETQTAEEEDSLSQTEYTDSCPAVSDTRDISEADDEETAEPDELCCETCSKEFSSDADLKRHISESHGGPYVCHLCGILMWQKNAVHDHYGAMHPGSPILFEMLHRHVDSGSKEVGGSGMSEKKIAVVQGTHIIIFLCYSEY